MLEPPANNDGLQAFLSAVDWWIVAAVVGAFWLGCFVRWKLDD